MTNSPDPKRRELTVGFIRPYTGAPVGECDPFYESLFFLMGDIDKSPCNETFNSYLKRPYKILAAERRREKDREVAVVRLEFVPNSWAEYRFDLATNYLMSGMKYFLDYGAGSTVEGSTEVVRFREGSAGVFFPEEVVKKEYANGQLTSTTKTVFQELRLNLPVPADAYNFHFRENTPVQDLIQGTSYVVGPNGLQKGAAHPIPTPPPPRAATADGARRETQVESSPRSAWIAPLSVLLIGTGIVFWGSGAGVTVGLCEPVFPQGICRTMRHSPLILTPLLIFGIAYGLSLRSSPKPPLAEVIDVIDLGDRELGSAVSVPVSLTNKGGRELVIDSITSDCSCSGLELDEGGVTGRPDSFVVRPGEVKVLSARVAVRGRPGEPSSSTIYYTTNEPGSPRRSLRLFIPRVTGVSVTPASLVFGEVDLGSPVTKIAEVRDLGGEPLSLVRLENFAGPSVAVRVVPPSIPPEAAGADGTRLISRVEFTVTAQQVGAISGSVRLHLVRPSGSVTVDVSVTASVVPLASLSPSRVVLPRASESGPVYEAVCLLRNRTGQPLTVSVEFAPPGLAVTVEPTQDASRTLRLKLVWTPPVHLDPRTSQAIVRLLATGHGHAIPVELPVELK